MKKLILIIISAVLSLLVCFFYLDYQLYYYGRNDLKSYHSLPFNITPIFLNDFEGGFYLADEDGLSIISKGENNWISGEHLTINKLIGYGFSKDQMVVKVKDSRNDFKYVEIRKGSGSNQALSFRIINTPPLISGKFKFIELDANYISNFYIVRNYIELFIIFFTGFILYILFKRKALNKNNQ
ncbi:hypothetical protein FFF34_015005 [Inquilinus sp. KBS0705]|nr:hypothetical protein FFF34_015005 [Inquilinus sp. KBS0705]